jgi:predicted enzyme related to lactoylglutathione lyase
VALGATLLGGPFDRPRGRLAVLRDPGGATLGVWQAGLENRATFAPGSAGGWGWFDRTVADPPAVATFYEGWLGWRSDASGPSDGRHLSRTLHVGNLAVAGVHRRTEPGDGDGSWVVYFDVPSCDDAIRRALTLGGRLIGRVSPGSPCRAVLSDPEDVPFGIQGPR